MSNEESGRPPGWIELRDGTGRLQARYDPDRNLLEIQRRGVKTLYDLAQWQVAGEA